MRPSYDTDTTSHRQVDFSRSKCGDQHKSFSKLKYDAEAMCPVIRDVGNLQCSDTWPPPACCHLNVEGSTTSS